MNKRTQRKRFGTVASFKLEIDLLFKRLEYVNDIILLSHALKLDQKEILGHLTLYNMWCRLLKPFIDLLYSISIYVTRPNIKVPEY